VYDGIVPGVPTARYVCVYGATGTRTADAIDGASRSVQYDLQIQSVAVNGAQCRWLATQVRDALTDWVPAVDGQVSWGFQHQLSRRPVADESVADRHLMYAVDQFVLIATRTT
jgi:hypothetical protein